MIILAGVKNANDCFVRCYKVSKSEACDICNNLYRKSVFFQSKTIAIKTDAR